MSKVFLQTQHLGLFPMSSKASAVSCFHPLRGAPFPRFSPPPPPPPPPLTSPLVSSLSSRTPADGALPAEVRRCPQDDWRRLINLYRQQTLSRRIEEATGVALARRGLGNSIAVYDSTVLAEWKKLSR